jgi:hypothetical protein
MQREEINLGGVCKDLRKCKQVGKWGGDWFVILCIYLTVLLNSMCKFLISKIKNKVFNALTSDIPNKKPSNQKGLIHAMHRNGPLHQVTLS